MSNNKFFAVNEKNAMGLPDATAITANQWSRRLEALGVRRASEDTRSPGRLAARREDGREPSTGLVSQRGPSGPRPDDHRRMELICGASVEVA